jgi:hypothetical protein
MAAGFSGAEIVREVGWSGCYFATPNTCRHNVARWRASSSAARGAREQAEAGDRKRD